jgi:hypothetical protein
MKRFAAEPLPGYEPEIASWLWALEEARRRTLRFADGLDQRTLDWEGPDGEENSIGSLLYHIGAVEMGWLFFDLLRTELPPAVQADFPLVTVDENGRLTRVPGVPLDQHLGRLARSRAVFLDAFRGMTRTEWRRLRSTLDEQEDYEATPEWVLFHLVEHEAGHAFQISVMKKRALRVFARPSAASPMS